MSTEGTWDATLSISTNTPISTLSTYGYKTPPNIITVLNDYPIGTSVIKISNPEFTYENAAYTLISGSGPISIVFVSLSTAYSNPKWSASSVTTTNATSPFTGTINLCGLLYYTPTYYFFGPQVVPTEVTTSAYIKTFVSLPDPIALTINTFCSILGPIIENQIDIGIIYLAAAVLTFGASLTTTPPPSPDIAFRIPPTADPWTGIVPGTGKAVITIKPEVLTVGPHPTINIIPSALNPGAGTTQLIYYSGDRLVYPVFGVTVPPAAVGPRYVLSITWWLDLFP